jgi:uncharacterized protein
MPLINSTYKNPHKLLYNGHLQTIYPALFRKIKGNISKFPERLTTSDSDFLDLDWYLSGNKKLVIISHGLEGDTDRPYMLGLSSILSDSGFDVLCWNMRSCSGETNLKERFYHLGATPDLDEVINYAISKNYSSISLAGFSAGGNLTLKYLGEKGEKLNPIIKKAITFSVPLHLSDCTQNLAKFNNRIYERRFLKSLIHKIHKKATKYPEIIDWNKIKDIKHIWHFDEYITAPLHGFAGAEDYYEKSSSIHFVSNIKIPTMVINALNDPFLGKKSFPFDLFENLENVYFETPKTGGHCGFYLPNKYYWSEIKALEFLTN